MSSISDSESVLLTDKLLPQHQAAISLIVGELEAPLLTDFTWLDLCCGKGQILQQLKGNISDKSLGKIHFKAVDIDNDAIRINETLGKTVGFKSYTSTVGQIEHFPGLEEKNKLNFITYINSLHEIDPMFIPEILLECVIRLESNGVFFMYDMEKLEKQELGAITWTRTEILEIVNWFMKSLNISDYLPEPQGWSHSKVTGWSIQIYRKHINHSLNFNSDQKKEIINTGKNRITELLIRKKEYAEETLQALTHNDVSTGSEDDLRIKTLYDFWAIHRILSNHKK